MDIETIRDFGYMLCSEPPTEDLFTVFSLKSGKEVFCGNWNALLDSKYADKELASWELHPRQDILICFNLNDERY